MSTHPEDTARLLMPPPMYAPPQFKIPLPPGPRSFPAWRGGRHPHRLPQGRHFLHPRQNRHAHVSNKRYKQNAKKTRNLKSNTDTEHHGEPSKPRPWNLKDAERALAFEKEYIEAIGGNNAHISITFPEPDLRPDNVRRLHPNIKTVESSRVNVPRHCIIKLRAGADAQKVTEDLNKKSLPEFGGRCLVARALEKSKEVISMDPEFVDPYTLFIGNLPYKSTVLQIKNLLPKAIRRDVGYSRKVKRTRYAMIRFSNLKDAIEGFKIIKSKAALDILKYSLIIRFYRFRLPKDVSGQSEETISAAEYDSDEFFHYFPEARSNASQSQPSESDTESDIFYDPDEYDLDELNPPPKPPSLALLRFIKSNDDEESYPDFDLKKNLTVLPDDVISVHTTDSLLDLDRAV